MNTATHEIGHFLGFAHSDEPDATMFASATPGETLKRFLSCDDAAILWFRYPAGNPNIGACKTGQVTAACGQCAPGNTLRFVPTAKVTGTSDGVGGCSCGSSPASSLWLLGLAAVLGLRGLRGKKTT